MILNKALFLVGCGIAGATLQDFHDGFGKEIRVRVDRGESNRVTPTDQRKPMTSLSQKALGGFNKHIIEQSIKNKLGCLRPNIICKNYV